MPKTINLQRRDDTSKRVCGKATSLFKGGCKPIKTKERKQTNMANEQNLIRLSPKEARELGSKGGKASVESRRERKMLREAMEICLSGKNIPEDLKQKLIADGHNPDELDHRFAGCLAMIEEMEKGSVAAYNAIRDIIGEKPSDDISIDMPRGITIQVVNVGEEYLSDNEQEIK